MESPLIVGDASDPHVGAVTAALHSLGADPVVLDVASLATRTWRRSGDSFELFGERGWARPGRAWLRRLAPAGHHHGVQLGSRAAAEAAARLALIASLSESNIAWLSDYWSVLRAENKVIQYAVAEGIGLPVPESTVASDVASLDRALGNPIVIKPLGPGEFFDAGQAYAVHSRSIDREDPALVAMQEAPFIVQRQVAAERHLRVVTVAGRAWTAVLEAAGLPLDWRRDETAHTAWVSQADPQVEVLAVRLADALNLGYSSQDWIRDQAGECWFLDGNPGGQWLFLPDDIGDAVAAELARWLVAT